MAFQISSRGLNLPHHNANVALLRGRWHRQKDKNHSPFHGEKPSHSTQPFNTAIQPNHSTQPFNPAIPHSHLPYNCEI
ncbi:MAG: hypothetical protein PUH61_00410 [Bacteroidales bacterium]|nr:hypothetical protein [Bacteroidales bacterium]MDY2710049.1 hypothetical protein [Sodaliphilus sp.]